MIITILKTLTILSLTIIICGCYCPNQIESVSKIDLSSTVIPPAGVTLYKGATPQSWQLMYPGRSTSSTSKGDVLALQKTGGQQYWNGIISPGVNIEHYRGTDLQFSFSLKVNDIKSYGSKHFHYFVAAIDFFKAGRKDHIKRKFVVFNEPIHTWDHNVIKAKVPLDADHFKVKFMFGKATGNVLLKDIKVTHTMFNFTLSHSETFTYCLPVQQQQSPKASASTLTIAKAGKTIARNHITFSPDGLHFTVNVQDKKFYQTYDKAKIWKGDSIQMAFDPKYTRTKLQDDDDYELVFSAVKGEAYIYPYRTCLEKTFEKYRIKYKFAAQPNNLNYAIDIPWGVIQPLTYKNITKMGYAFTVNNNDGDSKGRQFHEWASGIAHGKKPNQYGILIFDRNERFIASEVELNQHQSEYFDGETAGCNIWVPTLTDQYKTITCTIALNNQQAIQRTIPILPGENRITISFPVNGLKPDKNTLSIQVSTGSPSFILTDKSFVIRRLSLNKIYQEIIKLKRTIESNLKRLDSNLTAYADNALKPRELIATRGIVELFLPCIDVDMKGKRYSLALKEAQEVNLLLEQALTDLESGNFRLSKEKSVIPLKMKNGAFYNSNGEAVFPFGVWGDTNLKIMKSLGFTLAGIYWPPFGDLFSDNSYKLSPKGHKRLQAITRQVKERAAHNMLCISQPASWASSAFFEQAYPDAMVKGNHFFPFDPDHPQVRKLWQHYVSAFVSAMSKADCMKDFLSLCIQGEPAFSSITKHTLSYYRTFLQQKRYKTINELNRCWKSKFKSFDAIKDPALYFNQSPVAYYDWCLFNNVRFADYFNRFKQHVGANTNNHSFNVHARLMNGIIWRDKHHYNTGYDRERLMDITTINGCDTRVYPDSADSDFALTWQNQVMSFDFQKSLTPDKAIFDGEWHAIQSIGHNFDNVSATYLRCALRMATWHGLGACRIWGLISHRHKGQTGAFFFGHPHTQPIPLEAYCRESIRIDQEMDRIVQFQTNERPVRIYYSLSSAIFDGTSYLKVLKQIYRALYFQDLNLGFVTERMLKEGLNVGEIKVLIIPNARYADPETLASLEKLARSGVKILLIGNENMSRNTYNQLNRHVSLPNAEKWPIEKHWKAYEAKAEGLLKAAECNKAYSVVLQDKSALKTIEARFTNYKGHDIGYAVNVGSQALSFNIVNQNNQTMAIDAIESKTRQQKVNITLKPLEFIRFNIWK